MKNTIFVFGSNLKGEHIGGSACEAYEKYGAEWGEYYGYRGTSFAIPTLDENYKQLPLSEIEKYVQGFLIVAKSMPEKRFNIVAIGCGIAGFTPKQIAPMFKDASSNCILPPEFLKVLQ